MKYRDFQKQKADDIEKFKSFVERWNFQNAGGAFCTELCWSFDNRDDVDPSHESDAIVLKYGNKMKCEGYGSIYALTVGDWIYMLDSALLERRKVGENPIILMYRAHWDNVEIVDGNSIRIRKRGK